MNHPKQHNITPIFGFGYMRSGTTLLFNILKNHPDIYTAAQEPKIIDSISIIRKSYADLMQDDILRGYIAYVANVARFSKPFDYLGKPLTENDEFQFEDIDQIKDEVEKREFLPVMRLVYDHLAKKSGKKFWYIKSQIVFFDEIQRWIPDARYVEIVRDPRDVLASKKKDKKSVVTSKYSAKKKPLKALEKTYDPIWDSLSWKSEVSTGIKIKKNNPDQIYSIRYEDLANDPEKFARQVCGFLRIEFFTSQLNVPRRNSAIWDDRPSGIGSESVNKWERILNSEEENICQFITKKEMDFYNYERISIKYRPLKLFLLTFGSIKEFFQRLIKRLKMGGIPFLKAIIRTYWKKFSKLVHL